MIVNEAIGNILHYLVDGKTIDYVDFEWFEANKRVQRKKSKNGEEVAIKFLKEGQKLNDGDILYQDDNKMLVVNILETEAIVITPKTMLEMGTICYEIGNKHIPLFIQEEKILLPFEKPMFRWLEASGYSPKIKQTKLLNLLKSNVEPHGHGSLGSSIFTKILKMASTKDE